MGVSIVLLFVIFMLFCVDDYFDMLGRAIVAVAAC